MASLLKRVMENNNAKIPEDSVIIPIPISKRAKRRRGYNQAECIAKCFSEESGITSPIRTDILLKHNHTKSQVECADSYERSKNIAGAFTVTDPSFVEGKTIILIDDVFTSGSTLREAVYVLRKAGAKDIMGVVFAKA